MSVESILRGIQPVSLTHCALGAIVVAVSLVLFDLFIYRNDGYEPQLPDLPVVGDPNAPDFRSAMEEGARKYPNNPYILPAPTGKLIILPPSAIDEVRLLPAEEISSKEHHYRHFLGRWTKMGTSAHELHAALTTDLQRNVQKVLDAACDEVDYAFSTNMPSACADDWSSVPVFPTFLRISALLIERTWVGLPLSREDDWIQATTSFMTDVAKAAASIRAWPRAARPSVAPFLLEVKSLKRNRDQVTQMLWPVIERRLAENRSEGGAEEAGGELLTWLLQRYKGKSVSPPRLAQDELMATFSSLYTVTATLTQVLFDLAAQPEYLEPLREELAHVLSTGGRSLQKASLLRLKKMDSVIKESQRMNPLGLTTMMRVVMKRDGIKLSSGETLPYGATVAGPNHAINFNPTLYPNPAEFDGFRFSRLREIPGNETKFQLVSTSPDAINFGHGVNSCPGRFFASTEMKVMLSHLIENYDIKLCEGAQRPANVYTGTVCLPDMTAAIMFKKRGAA